MVAISSQLIVSALSVTPSTERFQRGWANKASDSSRDEHFCLHERECWAKRFVRFRRLGETGCREENHDKIGYWRCDCRCRTVGGFGDRRAAASGDSVHLCAL